MASNLYNAFPYATLPRRETHPDRLAAVGALFGMSPAPVTRCRMLEIGCGDGGNLLPIAYYLPGSRFVGVDLAGGPIAEASRAAAALGLANVDFLEKDFREVGLGFGEFDYIIAHGLYSWIPAGDRDRLLAVCRERLAPSGVAMVSYNVLPGRRFRQMLREMMLYHARQAADEQERIDQARWFLEFLAGNLRTSPAWQTAIEDEVGALRSILPHTLLHDDLAEVNDAVYFHDFAAHAASHGLQYLGDAEIRLMFDPSAALAWLPEDVIEREQYLDFLFLRRFRYTLLCREETALQRSPGPERMSEFFFSSPARVVEDGIEGCHGVRIGAANDAVVSLAGALRDLYPFPAAFAELVPYAGDPAAAAEILFALAQGGFAEIHAHDFPSTDVVSEMPSASRLARYQASRAQTVATACHLPAQLDDDARRLLILLDGTRTQEMLESELGRPRNEIRAALGWFAQMGLLEG